MKLKRNKEFNKRRKKWKKENKHDCYLNKNMAVVGSKGQVFYWKRKAQGWPEELCIWDDKYVNR